MGEDQSLTIIWKLWRKKIEMRSISFEESDNCSKSGLFQWASECDSRTFLMRPAV